MYEPKVPGVCKERNWPNPSHVSAFRMLVELCQKLRRGELHHLLRLSSGTGAFGGNTLQKGRLLAFRLARDAAALMTTYARTRQVSFCW